MESTDIIALAVEYSENSSLFFRAAPKPRLHYRRPEV